MWFAAKGVFPSFCVAPNTTDDRGKLSVRQWLFKIEIFFPRKCEQFRESFARMCVSHASAKDRFVSFPNRRAPG
jgi:hypothetical protein